MFPIVRLRNINLTSVFILTKTEGKETTVGKGYRKRLKERRRKIDGNGSPLNFNAPFPPVNYNFYNE